MTIGLTTDVAVLGNAGPVVQSSALKGSFRSVADTAARDAIPANFREAGMWVYTVTGSAIYQLGNDLVTWSVVTFGGGAGSAISTPSGTTLGALNDAAYIDGTLVYVQTFQELWVYNANDTTTVVNGVTVIASLTGKRFYRIGVPSNAWALQSVWHVSRVSGNDENNGLTFGSAIKTLAELMRRWIGRTIPQDVTVTIYDDLTGEGEVSISGFSVAGAKNVLFTGVPTVVRSGTITAYEYPDQVPNQCGTLLDAGATASDRLRRVVNTTAGPRLGGSTFYGKSTPYAGGGRITGEWYDNTYTSLFSFGTLKRPIVGDTFDVETLPRVLIGFSGHRDGGAYGSVTYQKLQLDGGTFGIMAVNANNPSAFTWFRNCFLNCTLEMSSNVETLGCAWNQAPNVRAARLETFNCIGANAAGSGGGINTYTGAHLGLYYNNTFDNTKGIVAGRLSGVELNSGCFYNTDWNAFGDFVGSHVNVSSGAVVFHSGTADGFGRLIGTVSHRRAVSSQPGGEFASNDYSKITFTGSLPGGDFEINKDVTGIRAFDETTGAYTAPITPTWAKMLDTVAAGGFDGNAVLPACATALTKRFPNT